jgi:hypothetical protein
VCKSGGGADLISNSNIGRKHPRKYRDIKSVLQTRNSITVGKVPVIVTLTE